MGAAGLITPPQPVGVLRPLPAWGGGRVSPVGQPSVERASEKTFITGVWTPFLEARCQHVSGRPG